MHTQKIYLLLVISPILLISCQRDVGIELLSSVVSSDSMLLVKKVDETTVPGIPGKSAVTSEYEYDSESKMTRFVLNSISGNQTRFSESHFIRDSKGRIVTIEIKSQRLTNGVPSVTLEGPAFDTSTTKVVYQDENSRKINYIKRTNRAGEKTALDSTVYEYDNNNHVKKTTIYYLSWAVHQPGDMLILIRYMTWTFNEKGSLTQIEEYGKTNSSFTMQIRYRFEYDDKINPLFRNEDVFLNQWSDFSPNNVVKNNVFIPATGENYDNTAVYQYRSDNKPLSATYFSPPSVVNASRLSTFYYK